MDTMIELKKIKKEYKTGNTTFEALKGIDLNIKEGEFVSIMGASGSGKSTLMNILGALHRPSSGHYILKGKNLSKYTDDELADFRNEEVGFIFQQFNLLKRTSVYDNVALPGVYGNIENLRKRVEEVLDIVGIKDKIKNKSNELSGGQIQRVAIARALLMNPSIIMADEPTGNLDSKTAFEIMDKLEEIHQQGNTIILVTHEEEIARYARRIIKLSDGLIVSDKKVKFDKSKIKRVK